MVTAETELFTYSRGPLVAQMAVQAEADAVASFDVRRGFRLAAEAQAQMSGAMTAQLGSDPEHASLTAAVQGSVGTSTRNALAAQLDVHGLWAEACAAAEARARIQGDLRVSGQLLLDALQVDAKTREQGLLAPMTAFLRHVQLNAGVYAEAYFAFRGRARLSVLGSVIPLTAATDHAGFSVNFDYGYAYIWGCGFHGFLDVGIPDVPAAVGATVEAAVRELLDTLADEVPEQLRPLLRMLVPLSSSAAIAVARTLGQPQKASPATNAPPTLAEIAEAFLTEVRGSSLDLALGALLEAGIERARQALTDILDQLLDNLGLDAQARGHALATLGAIRDLLVKVDTAQNLSDALPSLVTLCDDLAALLSDLATTPGSAQPTSTGPAALLEVSEALTVAEAAATLLAHVVDTGSQLSVPEHLAGRVRAASGGTGTPADVDVLEYIAGHVVDLQDNPFGEASWLLEVVGGVAPDLLGLLWHLGTDSDPAAVQEMARRFATALADKVSQELRPYLEGLPAGPTRELAQSYLNPMLDVLVHALVSLLDSPDQPSAERTARARDELDTLLTGVFGALVVRVLQTVVRPYFVRAPAQLRELADLVDRKDPAFAEFFAVANQASVVFRLSEAVVAASLRETAGMIEIANRTAFSSGVEVMESVILLTADSAERRAQLARLVDKDEARIGDAALREELLDGVLVKPTAFALEMIPPSIRMTTLITLDQGPVPLVTLFHEGQQIAAAASTAIADAGQVAGDVASVIASLLATGRISAAQLAKLAADLQKLIGDAADLTHEVLDVVKEISWPVFVTSTGFIGLALRQQFDDFFEAADELIDRIRDFLQHLVDETVHALVVVASDLGVLDVGEGDGLGVLEDAVRQATLGDPAQQGLDIQVLGVTVHLSHATLASVVANAALGRDEVRTAVRDFHAQAREQADRAREVAQLKAAQLQNAADVKAALEATLAAQRRPTGFTFNVRVEGFTEPATQHMTRFWVLVDGAGQEFITGPHPLVRVEVGGRPVPISPAAWQIEDSGRLRGQFILYSDPSLGAAHPFAAEGLLAVAPPAADGLPDLQPAPSLRSPQPASAPTSEWGPELAAVHLIEQRNAAAVAEAGWEFLTHSALASASAAVQPVTPDTFLPPVLRDPDPAVGSLVETFPAVLQVDRAAALAAAGTSAVASIVQGLPGTEEIAFLSAADLHLLAEGGSGLPASLSPWVPDGSSSARASAAAPTFAVVVRARPGYTPITASVTAVPQVGQDLVTTPRAGADPLWVALQPPTPAPTGSQPGQPPEPVDDAVWVQDAPNDRVPTVIHRGEGERVQVTMRNSGTSTWTWSNGTGYALALNYPPGNDDWGERWHPVTAPIPPGETVTFTFDITEPKRAGAALGFRMVHLRNAGDLELFGESTPEVPVTVLVDDAVFESVVAPSSIMSGSTAQVSVVCRNTGTSTWTSADGYHLAAVGHDFGTPSRSLQQSAVRPNETATFTFTIGPPPGATAAFSWRMARSGRGFGPASPIRTIARRAPATVPDVIHEDRVTAGASIRAAGLVPSFSGYPRQDGWVRQQNPVAGTIVAEGSEVQCDMEKEPSSPP